ncbi:MFS transporter [Streptomyces fumigatiscleroticus]|nr:MFS transporter [Streptomyces fumigatiscleroticus]
MLRVPHARRAFLAALVGRLSYGTVSVALLLSVTRATGSYTLAGTVMALFGAAGVVLSPYRAGLVDRYGPRRALIPMALLYAGLLGALAAAAWRPGAPAVLLASGAAVAGACAPPLGPAMRAVWAELLADRALLRRAYSLDGVAEELLYVTGPLVVGVMAGFGPPAAGVLLSALLVAVGTLAFALSPATAAVRPAGRPESRPGQGEVLSCGAPVQPVVVAAGVGAALSAVELLVVAFAGQRHLGDGVAAWVLAALSAGSAVGGLLYGAVGGRGSARTRLAFLALGLGLALAAAGLARGAGTLAVAVGCAGLFVAPALTTAYLIADEAAPPGFRTRAGAWVNTAVNAGSAAGAAGVGLLVDRLPPALCFAVAGAVAAATVPARLRDGGHARRRRRTAAGPAPASARRPGGTGGADCGTGVEQDVPHS